VIGRPTFEGIVTTSPPPPRRHRPIPGGPLALALVLLLTPLAACGAAPATHAAPGRSAPRARALGAAERAFVDTLQHRTFQWFWDTADPHTGLTPDRWPTRSFASVAAMGFGLAAYPVGVEHGWITREQGLERTLKTLRFLAGARQDSSSSGSIGYRGFFYHFLNPTDGTRFEHLELSFIDTGLLVAGAMFCGEYFDRPKPREREVGAIAESLYRRVDWRWMQVRPPLMCLGWTPEHGHLPYDTGHYNETPLELLLAMGSPTHPADPGTWRKYTEGFRWGTFHGQEYLGFAPLFGHQQPQIFVDFRGIQDDFIRGHGIDYFENSRRATLAQRQYAIDNPAGWDGYGALHWGLSACDGPVDGDFEIDGRTRHFQTYWARGASHTEVLDDGTLTPNAAGGSIAFAPEVVVPTLMAMKAREGDRLWSAYGFLDAYNPSARLPGREKDGIDPRRGWVDRDYLGIDQGLIVLMIENWRSGLIWRHMRTNPHLIRGLRAAGFRGGWLDRAPAERR
jgi:hypothetical protein